MTASALRPMIPRLRESKYRTGTNLWKLTHSQLGSDRARDISQKGNAYTPDQILRALTDLSRVSSPSPQLLSLLSIRCMESSHQFFPPQILETLSLFSKISFSDPNLFTFFSNRKDDLLNEASPRRLVILIDSLSDLQLPLFHKSIWPAIRNEVVRILPQLKRGIPNLIRSLADQGCPDEELLNALLKQAELNWISGEIQHGVFFASLEAASRNSLCHAQVREMMERVPEKLTVVQSIYLQTAAHRVGASEIVSRLTPILSDAFSDHDKYDSARYLELMNRLGTNPSGLSQVLGDYMESSSTCRDFQKKFLPFNIESLASISSEHDQLIQLILTQTIPYIDTMSGEKLLHLVRAADFAGANESIKNEILEKLKNLKLQLTMRQRRLLWENCPEMMVENLHALPPLLPLGKEHMSVDVQTIGPYSLVAGRGGGELGLRVPRYMQDSRLIELRARAIQSQVKDQSVVLDFTEF